MFHIKNEWSVSIKPISFFIFIKRECCKFNFKSFVNKLTTCHNFCPYWHLSWLQLELIIKLCTILKYINNVLDAANWRAITEILWLSINIDIRSQTRLGWRHEFDDIVCCIILQLNLWQIINWKRTMYILYIFCYWIKLYYSYIISFSVIMISDDIK